MHRVHAGPLAGAAGAVVLLGLLDLVTRIDLAGWAVGLGCAAGASLLLLRARARRSLTGPLGSADLVTLVRMVLVSGIVALGAGGGAVALLVGLVVVALVLDGVDGRVARRTRTVSELGARFDLEVDAFLILVLSAYVAPRVGWWVLLIGAARYLFVACGWVLPWLRGSAPPRPWCKVVAVVQGVVLTVAAADVLPLGWTRAAAAAALVLLAESFGHEAWDLWRLRGVSQATEPAAEPERQLVTRG